MSPDKKLSAFICRYTKYHPNVMLALFASRDGEQQSGTVPDSGVEESKFEELVVVASTSTSPAANSLIRSDAVIADAPRQYKAKHSNRQPFKYDISTHFDDVRYRILNDDAIEASNGESDLTCLDAHLKRIRIYEAQIIEAKHCTSQPTIDYVSTRARHFSAPPPAQESCHCHLARSLVL